MNKCNFAANRYTDVKDKQVSLAVIHVLILEETCLEQGELYGNPDADHIKICQSKKKRNVKVWLTCSWKGVVGKIDKLESLTPIGKSRKQNPTGFTFKLETNWNNFVANHNYWKRVGWLLGGTCLCLHKAFVT